jgi:hypothetical protein
MAEIPVVKSNIAKMIAQGAPEADIDAYLAGEGVSLDQLKAPVVQPVGMAEDAAKSVGSGLASATAGTLGMAGDARSLLSSGIDWAGGQMGVAPDKVQTFKDVASKVASMTGAGLVLNNAPTSRQITESAPDPIVSPDYKPQTALGGYLKTGTEFAPGMLTGGPRSLLTRLGTNVAAPAVASETAGLLTEGTAAEPYARVGGALLGGAAATKAANSMASASALKAATPSMAAVKSEATNAYDALTSRNVAIPIPQTALDSVVGDIATTLNNRGIRPSNAGSIHAAVDELKAPATAGAADVADLVAGRQSIKELLGKPDTNKTGAVVALGKIEAAIEQHSPGTMAKIREADKNYSAVKANDALDKRVAKADLRAAGENSGANVGNKIRQNITNLLTSNEAKYLSAETKADLEKIVRGTMTQNAVRAAANILGGGGGLGMLAGGTAGYQAGGWPGALAGAAAGKALKIANNRSVTKQAEAVAEAIRRRSPLGQQAPLALPPMANPLLGGLLPALLARPKQ